jgi:hypothetical protein
MLGILVVSLAASPAPAAERTMNEEIGRLAQDVQKYLMGLNVDAVAVGVFTGPAECNVEVQLRRSLVQELESLRVRIDDRARLEVKGKYTPVDLADTKRIGVEMSCILYDRQRGRTAGELKAKLITETTDIVQIVGLTLAMSPGATEEERHGIIRRALADPRAHVRGNAVWADRDSPYGMEVRRKGGDRYEGREPKEKEGLAFVDLAENDVYSVRLFNRADHEVAVTLTIDGLNVFSLGELGVKNRATRKFEYPMILIPPRSDVEVRGWPLTIKKSSEFKLTTYGESAVARLGGDPAKVGVITAQFAASWPKGGKPPADEGAKNLATGQGATIDAPFEPVERNVGRTRASVSIRSNRGALSR